MNHVARQIGRFAVVACLAISLRAQTTPQALFVGPGLGDSRISGSGTYDDGVISYAWTYTGDSVNVAYHGSYSLTRGAGSFDFPAGASQVSIFVLGPPGTRFHKTVAENGSAFATTGPGGCKPSAGFLDAGVELANPGTDASDATPISNSTDGYSTEQSISYNGKIYSLADTYTPPALLGYATGCTSLCTFSCSASYSGSLSVSVFPYPEGTGTLPPPSPVKTELKPVKEALETMTLGLIVASNTYPPLQPSAELFSSLCALESTKYGEIIADPPDANYAIIAQPAVVLPAIIRTPVLGSPAVTQAFNAGIANGAEIVAYSKALLTAIERSQGAALASATNRQAIQDQASSQFSVQLGALLRRQATLLGTLRGAIDQSGLPPITISRDDVDRFQHTVTQTGLSPEFVTDLTAAGATESDVNTISGNLVSQSPFYTGAIFPDILNDPSLIGVLQTASSELMDHAPCAAALDSSIVISQGKLMYDAATQTFSRAISIRNAGSNTIRGPFSLAFDGLSPAIRMPGNSGTTLCAAPLATPFVNLPSNSNRLEPGASLAGTVAFKSNTSTITYSLRLLAGAGIR